MTATVAAPPDEIEALRRSVAFTVLDHVVVLRFDGNGAFAALDRISTAPLYMREGEMRQTLLLTEGGHLFADAIIASDEEGYFLFAEGPSEAALLDHIERHCRPVADAAGLRVTSLTASHLLWGLNGPYAWELASALLGPAVLGMTYLTLLRPPEGDVVCFRGGKTGEYGYDLLIPRDSAATWSTELRRRGEPLDLRAIGLPALDQAALENWQLNVRTLGAGGMSRAVTTLTPIELQLQWRIGYDRQFVGAEALRIHRQRRPGVRLTCFTAASSVTAGDQVVWDGEPLGHVLAAAWSHLRGDHVGMALLVAPCAHPLIDVFAARTATGIVPLRTRTPPLLDNRSLYVDPHRHNYATRDADVFPPLVPA